ncbi:anti-sigma-I factor RsgI family protein [Aquibacillus rhizosphaerae]|uniref:RsgI N-terminal anti-sigma domain-containing protein n=1 Tax=Aquibacillus rhizosphaerae TaxID=3051431 RepID=A0ABT7L7M5_9BACI|nr:hypothetical protein [Aquibacillus sp. LR5S19]MDL4840591.1 hypothetical protein [Aquibacillus sp. LR5S19]
MKSKTYKGIVVNVTDEKISLLCKNGDFKNVPRSKSEIPRIGQSYTHIEKQSFQLNRSVRYVSLVAIVFLTLIGYYMSTFIKEEESYLFAVDINPSIEIYTDENFQVTKMEFLNKDGEIVVNELRNKGAKITSILEEIITVAINENYLSETENGLVNLTVIPLENKNELKLDEIEETVRNSLRTNVITADVSVDNGSKDLIEESRKVNLSINKYQLYKQFRQKGIDVDVDNLRENPIASFMDKFDETNTTIQQDADNNENEDKSENILNSKDNPTQKAKQEDNKEKSNKSTIDQGKQENKPSEKIEKNKKQNNQSENQKSTNKKVTENKNTGVKKEHKPIDASQQNNKNRHEKDKKTQEAVNNENERSNANKDNQQPQEKIASPDSVNGKEKANEVNENQKNVNKKTEAGNQEQSKKNEENPKEVEVEKGKGRDDE